MIGDGLAVFDSVTGKLHLLSDSAAQVWTVSAGSTGDVSALTDLVLERTADPALDRHAIHAIIGQRVDRGLLPTDAK